MHAHPINPLHVSVFCAVEYAIDLALILGPCRTLHVTLGYANILARILG